MCLLLLPNAAITSPSDESEPLIFFASSKRCPVAPDSLTRSEPARSTKFKQDSIFWPFRAFSPDTKRMKTKKYRTNFYSKITGMRSRGALVAIRRRCFPPLVGALDEIRELRLRRDLVAAKICHVDVFRASSFDLQLFLAA